ncbi:hypothetical protein IIA16_01970, partial [bacterium]|nr:hypothetical protein [bacterium]
MQRPGFLALAAIAVCLLAGARPRLPSLGDCGLGPSAPDGVAYATLVRPIGPFATSTEAEESLHRLGFGDARARAEEGLLVICPGRFRPGQIPGLDWAGAPPPGAGALSRSFVAGRPVPAWPAWRDFLLEFPRNIGDSLSWRASGPGRLELSWTTGGAWQGHRVVEYSGRDPGVLAAALAAAGPDPGPEALGRRLRRAYAKAGHKRARVSVRARQDSWGRWTEISLA